MKDRLGLKIVSVLLGIFAWVYVNIIVPPQVKRTEQASVEYRNKPRLMKITPETMKVQVELKGNRRDFIMSGKDKVNVSVDLYNLRPGKAVLPLKVTPSSGLSVVSVKPSRIEIDAIPLVRRDFPLSVEITGQTAEGYLAETPRIKPENVILEGTESFIESVTACQVDISLDQLKNSVSENRPVKIYTENGLVNKKVVTIPEKVTVDVTVKEGYPTRIVQIAKPVFINKLPEGKELKSFQITPEEIAISGPLRLLEQINELNTSPFDLSKLEKTATFSLELSSPAEKVKIIGTSSARIFFKLENVKVLRKINGLNFEIKKTDRQFTKVSVSSYSMAVEGYVEDVNSIRTSQLKVILDITGMKQGTYDVPLTVPAGLPDKVLVKNILPEAITVEVSQLATSTGEVEKYNDYKLASDSFNEMPKPGFGLE